MPLPQEVQAQIQTLVRAGFDDADTIVIALTEELYAPGDLDADEILTFVEHSFAQLEAEKMQWPPITDCDRLDQAFEQLHSLGVICLQNAGYTQSDGFSDVQEALRAQAQPESFFGYCFYHGQDLERAVNGEGLHLTFGPLNPELESTRGLEIGQLIVNTLTESKLPALWDGTFAQRIFISPFDWKRH